MSPGDRIRIHMHDTPAGLPHRPDRPDHRPERLDDRVGRQRLRPHPVHARTRPPASRRRTRSTRSTRPANPRGNTWSAHTYNVAMSDEIGHFENCLQLDARRQLREAGQLRTRARSTRTTATTSASPAPTRRWCKINGCFSGDEDFDGQSYRNDWPGTNPNPSVDRALHPSPVLFTSPLANGTTNYSTIAFETDLPRIEADGLAGQPAVLRPDDRRELRQPAQRRAVLPVLHHRRARTARAPGRRAATSSPAPSTTSAAARRPSSGRCCRPSIPAAGFTTVALLQQLQQRRPTQPLPRGLSGCDGAGGAIRRIAPPAAPPRTRRGRGRARSPSASASDILAGDGVARPAIGGHVVRARRSGVDAFGAPDQRRRDRPAVPRAGAAAVRARCSSAATSARSSSPSSRGGRRAAAPARRAARAPRSHARVMQRGGRLVASGWPSARRRAAPRVRHRLRTRAPRR